MNKKPWDVWNSKFEMVRDKCELWCRHIDGDIVVDNPELFEFKFPEDLGLFHLDKNNVYVTGIKPKGRIKPHLSTNYRMTVFGVDNEGTKPDKYVVNGNISHVLLTLDKEFGSIEVGEEGAFSENTNYIKIEFVNRLDKNMCRNWSKMTKDERKRFLNNMPESNHKKIIEKELKQSGLI